MIKQYRQYTVAQHYSSAIVFKVQIYKVIINSKRRQYYYHVISLFIMVQQYTRSVEVMLMFVSVSSGRFSPQVFSVCVRGYGPGGQARRRPFEELLLLPGVSPADIPEVIQYITLNII